MRTVTKTISLPLAGEPHDFILTKLDAFSGAYLLKLLSRGETDNLQALLFSLSQEEMENLMRTCLRSVSVVLPAGPIRALDQGSWGVPELEHDGWTCVKLTLEVISWTLEGFFPAAGSPS